MRVFVRSLVILVFITLAILPASSKGATCSACETAVNQLATAEQKALEVKAAGEEALCPMPWGGGEESILFAMDQAIADGALAMTYSQTASQTCSESAATSGLLAAMDARDHVADAQELCEDFCPEIPVCSEGKVAAALNAYQNAVSQEVACWVQARRTF